jgi:hypothetical protein
MSLTFSRTIDAVLEPEPADVGPMKGEKSAPARITSLKESARADAGARIQAGGRSA